MKSDLYKKMNILVVHNYYKMSGGEDTVFHNEVELLKSHGHNVITYTRNNREIDSFNTLKKMLVPFMYMFNLKTYIDLKKLIKKNNIDILHVHNTLSLIGGAAYFAGIRCNVPVVQTVHNFRSVCPNGLMCKNSKICDACIKKNLLMAVKYKCYHDSILQTFCIVISMKLQRFIKIYKSIYFICLTNFNRNILITLKTIDKNKVYVKPNSIKLVSYNLKACNERENYYCFVGRLDRFKGIEQLLRAINDEPNVNIYICGDGPLRAWCEEFISSNKLNCKILGNVDHDDVIKLISNSKGTIVPSIWYEGLPMTIIETFSTGTPIIGRNIGNIASVVSDNRLGRLFESDNELREILNKGFEFDENYIYNHFLNNYSDVVNYRNLMTIYESVLKSHKGE